MGVKTISVTDTAYNLLLSMKSEDEDNFIQRLSLIKLYLNVESSLLVKVFSLEKKLKCGQKNTDRRVWMKS